jgi:2-oxoisovalerate dehydrogenase E1 component
MHKVLSLEGKQDVSISPDEIRNDYRLAYRSRQVSLIARREVLSGKAKFGIFGDGKEVIQLAMARAFHKGDWRSGYYRDQTWIFALGASTIQEFFAQLYADADLKREPATGGRSMNSHFATRYLSPDGDWKNQTEMYNISADTSPTGTQMPRTVGLAYASVLYRHVNELKQYHKFSNQGNEVTWATIGNASTAEGVFWESINAIGVLHAPAVLTVFDDGYGISVPNQFQMVKENIYSILKGFERQPCPAEECDSGFDLYSVQAWDYPNLLATFQTAGANARRYHIPSLIHATDLTQPLGHSTSGSQERYKSPERLEWEAEFDCLRKFREWIISNDMAKEDELVGWEAVEHEFVENERKQAWEAYQKPLLENKETFLIELGELAAVSEKHDAIVNIEHRLKNNPTILRRNIATAVHDALVLTRFENTTEREKLVSFSEVLDNESLTRYGSHLYSQSKKSALQVKECKPKYSSGSALVMGFQVLNAAFDAAFERYPQLIAFGEDVGKLGDVNQGLRGLQEKYGTLRVSDTGIRETTILGQAIGMAMRGLRPIAEVQYLDYLLYCLQIMADDLANLLWRTVGGQKAPVIVRTRGHRLEGIWHSGSPMAGIINLVRGMNVLVPRDMTRAAGFYNTILKSDEPALIIEVLNGYRLKEKIPDNIGEFTVPVGIPEIIRSGSDVTIVTYGACCRIAMEAAQKLAEVGIESEVIDVQSLLPFDIQGKIGDSLKRTSRILFLDEDVPGGTSAYMMQEVIEKQQGYFWLDSPPKTLSGKMHRPAYGSDGDYWSKPNVETTFDAVYELFHEVNPIKFPEINPDRSK